MTVLIYTAKRSLISGHVAGIDYAFVQPMRRYLPSPKKHSFSQVAISGDTETIFHRLDKIWSFTTAILDEGEFLKVQEFADSVADGGTFFVDWLSEDAGSLIDPQPYILEGDAQPNLVSTQPLYRYSFKARAL